MMNLRISDITCNKWLNICSDSFYKYIAWEYYGVKDAIEKLLSLVNHYIHHQLLFIFQAWR